MDLDETEKLFPGVKEKLNAPRRRTAFARERHAAEAKQREEEAARAELLKSFEQSFEFDSAADARSQHKDTPRDLGSTRNHGWNGGPRSGPGSLGPTYDGSGPPDRKRKRALEQMRMEEAERGEEMMYDGKTVGSEDTSSKRAREQEELHVPRLCIHLSSLPPAMTTEQVRAILSPHLVVGAVRFHSPFASRTDVKRCVSATAWLSPDTTTQQIDDAVTKLRDRYVGCGFTMKASRLAPSSNTHPSLNGPGADQPFGARRAQASMSLNNAPPPEEPGRFAPPDRYDRRGPPPRELEVNFDRPLELSTVRVIHTIADSLLSQSSPGRALEMEALLMSLPEVQTDERFAFLYDSRSPAGLYYRYCLWRDDHERNESRSSVSEQIFDDCRAKWRPPSKRMPYSKLADLSDALNDIDYVSSDESDNEKPQAPPFGRPEDLDSIVKISITPLQRARFTHLLARLPTVNTRLRKGDLARITDFAISHAVDDVDEIVDMLLLNVELPFSISLAAKYEQGEESAPSAPMMDNDDEEEYDPEKPLPAVDEERPSSTTGQRSDAGRDADPSSAKLVALYVISDVLHAIASSEGAKNAWKFRQLFELGFKHQKTFERLGKLDREYGWGKIKSEQWKRKIGALFDIWENSSAFASDVIRALKASFAQDHKEQSNAAIAAAEASDASVVKKPRWMSQFQEGKSDPDKTSTSAKKRPVLLDPESRHLVKKKEEDVAQDTTSDIAQQEMAGTGTADTVKQPLSEQGHNANAAKELADHVAPPGAEPANNGVANSSPLIKPTSAAPPKKRMRAEDMFAESDED